ncbi:predicted protein [Chaetoceros tenuissimus]|uniref:Uncharacterized protein n=1 Tax=Chaetoceros tenuissimus TaxID=426638 RepID=A0AAD3H592_9STRA|nr:predicted protein [Chaetoceros tenuissimus]
MEESKDEGTPKHIFITPHSPEDDDCSELLPRSCPMPTMPIHHQQPQPQPQHHDQAEVGHSHQDAHLHQADETRGNFEVENQQLRTILRDLGLASLIPNHRDEEASTYSSQLSASIFQNQNYRTNSIAHSDMSHLHSQLETNTLLHELQSERNELRNVNQIHSLQITDLSNQLHAASLAKESSNQEMQFLQTELNAIRQHLEEERKHSSLLQNEIRNLQNDKNGLWNQVHQSNEEKRMMQQKYQQIEHELQNVKMELQSFQNASGEWKERENSLQESLHSRMKQVTQLESEKNELQHNLQKVKQETLARFQKQNMDLVKDLESARVNGDLNVEKMLQLQELAARYHAELEQVKSDLEDSLRDKNSLKDLLDCERRKCNELEESLSTFKMSEVALEEQMSKIIKEKAQMATKLNEATARLNSRPTDSASKRTGRLIRKGKENVQQESSSASNDYSSTGNTVISDRSILRKNKVSQDDIPHSNKLFKAYTPGRKRGQKSIQQKQRALEDSLKALEVSSHQQEEESSLASSAKGQHSKRTMSAIHAGMSIEALKREIISSNDNDDDQSVGTLSLMDPLSLTNMSPPTKVSVAKDTCSVLDFVSVDGSESLLL